jgi:hypothetical protein
MRSVDRKDLQRLVHTDALIESPSGAVPALPCHHALHSHHRSERTGRKIGSSGDSHSCVDHRPEGHTLLHELLTIEPELVRVVIGV